jgi:predicted molibdopterin-dependent oxidoreductase YjgC
MVSLKINNTQYLAEEGTTILDMAVKAGFKIPTLCHMDRVEHYASCMACIVRDKASNKFIPSCSSLVQENMDIDVSGDDVVELRKKSIELLLSEHRAECEAPCRVVCPSGYDIPLMNRHLSSGNFDEAVRLTMSEVNTPEIACISCKGYCENACRRKKEDVPISIRNIKIFIFHSAGDRIFEHDPEGGKTIRERKLFLSQPGKIEADELREWLKESKGEGKRFREITTISDAGEEAKSCMHCDCRAARNCKLREIAGELAIKDPRGKLVNAPIEKKINKKTGLIFENAKCIKCGLCVRICEDSTDSPALCFINRGFVSIISEPLGESFDNVLTGKSAECIKACPTGALSDFNSILNTK